MKKEIITIILLCICSGCSKCSKEELPYESLDYSRADMWYESETKTHETDVFYVTPTCIWDWKDANGLVHHYMDTGNPEQRAAVDGSNRLAETLFSKSCRFYSPYYRQITMDSWMLPKDEINRRYAVSHRDVIDAFEYYMKYQNGGRPFILAGHSQGAKAVLELLKHSVTEARYKNMVAAYLFGFEISQKELDDYEFVKPAQDSLDCGVVVCYNSVSTPSAVSPLFENNVVCINPINWRTDATYAPPQENLGSVFFNDNGTADTLFQKVGARIDSAIHTLIIDGLTDDDYYIPSISRLFPKGNYHVQEINLYFLNLQKNIRQRIESFNTNSRKVKYEK